MVEPSVDLPHGGSVTIASEAVDKLSCGVILFDPVEIFENHQVQVETAELSLDLQKQYQGMLPSEIAGLTEARNLYKSFNMDPSRHRPSSEALLRRVIKGKGLYQINNAVDCCNLASLSFLLPVGMYDWEKVRGDVTLRSGREGESYPGIRKGDVNLSGRLALFDLDGAFGSPTSDSARTCVSDQTRQVLVIIMATHEYSAQAMQEAIIIFSTLFQKHCRATTTFSSLLAGGSE
ncbi:MAG: hypothetical protein GY780_13760 [bacterium]|nr:hypothetical protein [bacterium]